MKNHRGWGVVCAWAMAIAGLITGCGDDGDGSAATTGTATQGLTYSGIVTQAGIGNPLEGVNVCAVEPDVGCTTSAADGAYAIGNLPKNTIVKFKATKDGFLGALGLFDVKEVDRTDVNPAILDLALVESVYGDEGVDFDETKGSVGILASDSAVMHGSSGYAMSLSPTGGDGPYYVVGAAVDVTLTATTDAGGVAIINLDDGDYVASADGPGTCTSDLSASSGSTDWRAPVEGGFLTYIILDCPDGAGDGTGGGGGAGGSGPGGGGAGGGN